MGENNKNAAVKGRHRESQSIGSNLSQSIIKAHHESINEEYENSGRSYGEEHISDPNMEPRQAMV